MLFYPFYGAWKKSAMNNYEISDEDSLLTEIERAKNEWEHALKRFNDVSEPDMVDYITFYIIAAERRYMYLLNKYKNMQKKAKKTTPTEIPEETDKEVE